MFRTTVGHADGDLRPIYLLISDQAVYILSGTEKKSYKKKAAVAFREIDYIAVILNIFYEIQVSDVTTQQRFLDV